MSLYVILISLNFFQKNELDKLLSIRNTYVQRKLRHLLFRRFILEDLSSIEDLE